MSSSSTDVPPKEQESQVQAVPSELPCTAVPPKEQGAQAETCEAASNEIPCTAVPPKEQEAQAVPSEALPYTAVPPKEQEAQAVSSEAASSELPCTSDPGPDKEEHLDTTVAAQDVEEKSKMAATCKETDLCKETSGIEQAVQVVCVLLHFTLYKVSRISNHYSLTRKV